MAERLFAGDRPRTVPAALAWDAVAFFAAAAIGASFDCVWVSLAASPSPPLLALYGAVGIALAAWLALFAALILVPARALGRAAEVLVRKQVLRVALSSVGYASVVLILGALVLRPWELGTNLRTYRPIAALCLGVLAITVMLVVTWRKTPTGAALAAGCLAVAIHLANATVLVSVYPRWHDTALLLSLLLVSVAVRSMSRLQQKRVAAGLAAGALLFQLALIPPAAGVVELGAEKGLVVPRFVFLARGLMDHDGDRFASVLGGGDCNDANAEVFPGQCEQLNNGVDDNCNGISDPPAPALSSRPERVPRERPDLYFVLLDGARADFAGLPREQIAPEIDRFAKQALRFSRAYTPYPSTFRAITSLLASRYWRYLGKSDESFFAAARRAGWDVGLLIRDVHIRDVEHVLDFGRKEDAFSVRGAGKEHWTQSIVNDAISEFAREDGPPRLRWLHLLDTHAPWLHPDSSGSDLERYRAEIAHASRQLGRFFDALDATPRGQRAVVVMLADHGEALGQRGGTTHGGTLYDELVRVPLFMRLPGVAPAAIDGVASLLDIVPTLAHYLGLTESSHWQGLSWLTGCAEGQCRVASHGSTPRVIGQLQASAAWGYAGLPALEAVSDGRYKLIVDLDRGRKMLFDLEHDPAETAAVVEPPRGPLRALEQALANWEDLPGCANRL